MTAKLEVEEPAACLFALFDTLTNGMNSQFLPMENEAPTDADDDPRIAEYSEQTAEIGVGFVSS